MLTACFFDGRFDRGPKPPPAADRPSAFDRALAIVYPNGMLLIDLIGYQDRITVEAPAR